MKHSNILLTGGSGFIGKHLAVVLANRGCKVWIPCRRPHRHRDLRVHPNIQVVEANLFDSATLTSLCKDMDAVINLVGILHESRKGDFRRVHIDFVKSVVEACRANKVRRLLHVSALGANQASGSSQYLRSKGEGENLIHTFGQNELDVTSFQPSVVFGSGDQFINQFANILKFCPLFFPIACGKARMAPVYVGDLVKLIADAIDDKSTFTKHYPVCGPDIFTLQEILQLLAAKFRPTCRIIALNNFMSRLQARVMVLLPVKLFTMDNYRSLQTDSVCKNGTPAPTGLREYVSSLANGSGSKSHYDRFRSQR